MDKKLLENHASLDIIRGNYSLNNDRGSILLSIMFIKITNFKCKHSASTRKKGTLG